MSGRVEAIHVVDEHDGSPRALKTVCAQPGRGLEGDRHFDSGAHDLTLVEAEALEGLAADTGIVLAPGESRRQLTMRGVRLDDLVGERFRVGQVACLGEEACEPCSHLEDLTQPGVLRGLVHRGGLCARVLNEGEIGSGTPWSVASLPRRAKGLLRVWKGSGVRPQP